VTARRRQTATARARRPRVSSGGDEFSSLQRQVGNAAVAAMVQRTRPSPDPKRDRFLATSLGTQLGNRQPGGADGPTAATKVGGRQLNHDGHGATDIGDGDDAHRVATISGSSIVASAAAQKRSRDADSPGTDVEYERSGPAVSGKSLQQQLSMIFESVMRARLLLDRGFDALMGSDTLPEKSMQALTRNFHNVNRSTYPTTVSHLYDIQNSIAKTRAAFDKLIPVEIETAQEGRTLGYVNVYRIFGPSGPIHLLPLWFTKDPDYRAQIIVHEACHRYDNDDDHAYRWQTNEYASMSVSEAIDNADSYAWFCSDVS